MPKSPKIYQLKISLKRSKSPIWRRVLVSSTITLAELHLIIQYSMGWHNVHLHDFTVGGNTYEPAAYETQGFGSGALPEDKVVLSKVASQEKAKIEYEYDFGDGWEHRIVVEKILPPDPDKTLPICIKGKGACPPEDCGGTWGYYEMVEAINDPKHSEHKEYTEWLGVDEWDVTAFDDKDLANVNHWLQFHFDK